MHVTMGTNTSNYTTYQDCQCRDQEMDQALDQFQSFFARQLAQSQATGNRPMIENMQTDTIENTTQPAI